MVWIPYSLVMLQLFKFTHLHFCSVFLENCNGPWKQTLWDLVFFPVANSHKSFFFFWGWLLWVLWWRLLHVLFWLWWTPPLRVTKEAVYFPVFSFMIGVCAFVEIVWIIFSFNSLFPSLFLLSFWCSGIFLEFSIGLLCESLLDLLPLLPECFLLGTWGDFCLLNSDDL